MLTAAMQQQVKNEKGWVEEIRLIELLITKWLRAKVFLLATVYESLKKATAETGLEAKEK